MDTKKIGNLSNGELIDRIKEELELRDKNPGKRVPTPAIDWLWKVYSNYVKGYLVNKKMGLQEEDIDDLISEAFIKFLKNIKNDSYQYDGSTNPKTYFTKICYYQAISLVRKEKKKGEYDENQATKDVVDDRDELMLLQLKRQKVLGLVKKIKNTQLKEDCRQIIDLKYKEGLDHVEIGEIMNLTPKYSRKKLSKCLGYLKKLLSNDSTIDDFLNPDD